MVAVISALTRKLIYSSEQNLLPVSLNIHLPSICPACSCPACAGEGLAVRFDAKALCPLRDSLWDLRCSVFGRSALGCGHWQGRARTTLGWGRELRPTRARSVRPAGTVHRGEHGREGTASGLFKYVTPKKGIANSKAQS